MNAPTVPRIAPLDRDELSPRQAEVLEGMPDLNLLRTMVRHPDLCERWVPFGSFVGRDLSPRDRELAEKIARQQEDRQREGHEARAHPQPRRRGSDPPNRLRGSRALLPDCARPAAERERRGWPYTGPRGGHFLLNLGRRSLADRDSLGVSLRGLCAAGSSGQQAPGRRASAASLSFRLPPLLSRETILSCAPEDAR